MVMQAQGFVYILRCADNSYYVGSHRGTDVGERVAAHNLGQDLKAYTFFRRPVACIWSEWFTRFEDAAAFERQLKGWSRAKKEAFMRGDVEQLKLHARRSNVRKQMLAQAANSPSLNPAPHPEAPVGTTGLEGQSHSQTTRDL